MNDVSFLFKPKLAAAIHNGTKTETRRIVSARNSFVGKQIFGHVPRTAGRRVSQDNFNDIDFSGAVIRARTPQILHAWHISGYYDVFCRYNPGQTAWVREAWRIVSWSLEDPDLAIQFKDGKQLITEIPDDIKYDDLSEKYAIQCTDDCEKAGLSYDEDGLYFFYTEDCPTRWRSSLHLPRFAARSNLLITSIRPERLNDITDAGAIAEGIELPKPGDTNTPKQNFAELWDSINKEGGRTWADNPIVWVISFRLQSP